MKHEKIIYIYQNQFVNYYSQLIGASGINIVKTILQQQLLYNKEQ